MSGLIDYNHYVLKERITQALVVGVAVMAVCGEVFTPSARPGGGGLVSEAAWEVCPLCEVIYDTLHDGASAGESRSPAESGDIPHSSSQPATDGQYL